MTVGVPLIRRAGRRGRSVLVMLSLGLCASAAGAVPYPTNPYSTVGGASPTTFCRNPIDNPGPYQVINLETVGCISGKGPSDYPDPVDGLYSNGDGLYASPGDQEDAVEQAIMMATGEVVDLLLYRESQSGSSTGSGIQIWVENGGKQFTWAFDQSLITLIEAGTLQISYLTIKGSNSYSLYEIPTGVYAGRYSTEGLLTNGGNQPSVSHIRFWKEIDYTLVPEPGAIALLAFGALALGLRRRRA